MITTIYSKVSHPSFIFYFSSPCPSSFFSFLPRIVYRNPINSIRHQLDASMVPPSAVAMIDKPKYVPVELTPAHTAYWAKGYGEGGEKAWRFACLCGETCSSYENYRYHPIGRMYECTKCSTWSHVECVLGKISDDDLEELVEVFCNTCRAKSRRQKLTELHNLNLTWDDGASFPTLQQ